MHEQLSGKAAIVGIGATDFSKDSGRSELRLAAEAVLGRARRRRPDARRRRRPGHVHDGHQHRDRRRARDGHRRAEVLLPDPLRRRRGLRDRPAGGDGGRHRRRAMCVVAYRAFNERSGHAVRPGAAAAGREQPNSTGVDNCVLLPARAVHAGRAGRDDRPALHARVRRDQRGLRRGSRSPTASTPPTTRRRTSTGSRSPSRTTRTRGGSPSRCGCSTAARRPTAASRSWSSSPRAGQGPASTGPRSSRRRRRAASPTSTSMISYYRPELAGCPRWAWSAGSCGRSPG